MDKFIPGPALTNEINRQLFWTKTGTQPRVVITDSKTLNQVSFGSGSNVLVKGSNPDYRKQIAEGVDAGRSYRKSVNKIHTASLKTVSKYILYEGYPTLEYVEYGECEKTFAGGYPAIVTTSPLAYDRALTKLKQKLRSAEGSKNVVIPIGELKDLRRSIESSFIIGFRLAKTFSLLRKGKFNKRREAVSALKNLSDAWLTYSFGIAPLAADISKISESISQFLNRTDHWVRFSERATEYVQNDFTDTVVAADAFGGHTLRTFLRTKISYEFTCGWNLQLQSSNDYDALHHFGAEVASLPSTAWELLPFSWVGDYFGTIGSFLEDAFYTPSGTLGYACVTKQVKGYGESLLIKKPHVSLREFSMTPGTLEYFEIERVPLVALPHQALRWKSRNQTAANWQKRIANLTAVGVNMATFKDVLQSIAFKR